MNFYEDIDLEFSIWDCAYSQEESCYLANVWTRDLVVDPLHDVIEEDALNEKSCIQVLNILMAKADATILEIEENIVMLRSELALADEKWNAVCFTTLCQCISHLDVLIKDLENVDENNVLDLRTEQMHPEPVERIHDVLMALLQDYISQSKDQNDVSFSSTSSKAQKMASNQPEKISNTSTSNMDTEISTTTERTLNSLSPVPGTTTADEGVRETVATAVTQDSAAEALGDEACSNQIKQKIRTGLEDFCEDEVGESSNTDESIALSETEEAMGIDFPKTAEAADENLASRVVSSNQEANDLSMKQMCKEAVTVESIEEETKSQLLETKMISKEHSCGKEEQGALLNETDHVVRVSLSVLYNEKDEDDSKIQIKLELQENYSPKTQALVPAKELSEPKLLSGKGKKQCKPESAVKKAASTPQKKRKTCPDLPVMKEDEKLRDFQMRLLAKSHSTPKHGESSEKTDSPVCVADLERMKVDQLMNLAKQYKLKGRHALRKAQLIQSLQNHLQLQGNPENT